MASSTQTNSATRKKPHILECTIRDGNYAVNFNFTKLDTAILTRELSQLGFQWIEVGHGLGLGASNAGKGAMPNTDEELIQGAVEVRGTSKIGMFFIPGIGTKEDLKIGADNGLQFVRIGYNATDLAVAYPFVEEARRLGLIPCINMMKSYAVSPKDFARYSHESFSAGAEVVYCVDSAGCMLPDVVTSYFLEAGEKCVEFKAPHFGFHGHNNLMLGVANTLKAYEAGADFLDSTLYGLGRSAGNAQTEVLVATLQRMGVETDIDLFKLLDVAEQFMWPLTSQSQMHSMMSVAVGYGSFHTSFLSKVVRAAQRHNSDPKRLIATMGMINPNGIDESTLETKAREFKDTALHESSSDLVDFQKSEFNRSAIRIGLGAVRELVDGMSQASAKMAGSTTALLLRPSAGEDSDTLIPDFILATRSIILGEVVFGSQEALRECVSLCKGKIREFIVDIYTAQGRSAYAFLREIALEAKLSAIDGRETQIQYLSETLLSLTQLKGSLFVYGSNEVVRDCLNRRTYCDALFGFAPSHQELLPTCCAVVTNLNDFASLKMDFDVALLVESPTQEHLAKIMKSVKNGGSIIMLQQNIHSFDTIASQTRTIDLRKGLAGFIERQSSIAKDLGRSKPNRLEEDV